MSRTQKKFLESRALRRLGTEMRLGGLFMAAVSTSSLIKNLPAERPEIMTMSGVTALGLYIATKVAGDCLGAAGAVCPKIEARARLKHQRPFYASMLFAAAAYVGTTLSDNARERQIPQPLINDDFTPAHTYRSDNPDLKNAVYKAKDDCPRGSSSMTRDEATGETVIEICMGLHP